jgi:hypothetical protein
MASRGPYPVIKQRSPIPTHSIAYIPGNMPRTFSVRKVAKDDNVEVCEYVPGLKKYVKTAYNLQTDGEMLDSVAPLQIFAEGEDNDFASLSDGIHNFILLFNEETMQHTFVTTYFNAFEYGAKHYMISKRLDYQFPDTYPDTFIFSGEFMKDPKKPANIKFHDWSSLYFMDNKVNLKNGGMSIIILLYSIDKYIVKHPHIGTDRTNISAADFAAIKTEFIEQYESEYNKTIYGPKKEDILNTTTVMELITYLQKNPLVSVIVSEKTYKDYVSSIFQHAFSNVFTKYATYPYKVQKVEMVPKFTKEEYADQIDKALFINALCRRDTPISYPIYNKDCLGEPIGETCAEGVIDGKSKGKTTVAKVNKTLKTKQPAAASAALPLKKSTRKK